MLENSPVERNRTEPQKERRMFWAWSEKDEREDNEEEKKEEEEEEASTHKHLHMTASQVIVNDSMEERGIAKERVEWVGGGKKKKKKEIGEFPSKQTSTR